MDINFQRGLSLIELMIAMTLSLLLMLGVLQIFLSSKNTYMTNIALAETQENARFALDALSFDLRGLGFKGACLSSFENLSGSGDSKFDLEHSAINGVQVGGGQSTDWLPPGQKSGTDALVVRYAVGEGIQGTGVTGDTVDLKVNGSVGGSKAGLAYILSDQVNCKLVVNQSTDNKKIVSTGSDLSMINSEGLWVYEYHAVVYSIGTGADGNPALFATDITTPGGTPSEIVSGVKQMRVSYGLHNPGSDQVTEYKSTKDMTVDDWSRVSAARVSLALQSSWKNVVTDGMSVTIDDSARPSPEVIAVPDRRFGLMVGSTVTARNYLP